MKKFAALAAVAVALSACGGEIVIDTLPDRPPAPFTAPGDGTAFENAGVYSVVQNGTTTTLPNNGINLNGQRAWADSTNLFASSYAGTGVLAIGGVNSDGTSFSGVSGTPVTAPSTDAPDGRLYFRLTLNINTATSSFQRSDGLALYDIQSNRLSANVSRTGLDGTRQEARLEAVEQGGVLSGTFTLNGNEADLKGGFFSGDQVAGAFNGNGVGGVFFGTH